jgi:hypothetical protein
MLTATVKRMPVETAVMTTNRRPRYAWRERFVLVSPDGKYEFYPPMTLLECRQLADKKGWNVSNKISNKIR